MQVLLPIHYNRISCLPRQFAATLPRRGKVAANFLLLRVKFAAKLPQQFAATLPRQNRNFLPHKFAANLPLKFTAILPRLCRDSARSRQNFFFP
jgi:hypothetical protein